MLTGDGLINVCGELFNPKDFVIKKEGGKLSYPHSTLALIDCAAKLVIDDPTNDLQYTPSGAVSLAAIRKLKELNLLPRIIRNGQQLQSLCTRLQVSCCEDGCFRGAVSKKVGGDGKQCICCYLDQRDGKDRVCHGMLKTFSTRQKVHVLTCLRAKKQWGLWQIMIDEGAEILKGKTRTDVRYCAEWLVKHEWYELQEGDEERGDEYKRAHASVTNGAARAAARKFGKVA